MLKREMGMQLPGERDEALSQPAARKLVLEHRLGVRRRCLDGGDDATSANNGRDQAPASARAEKRVMPGRVWRAGITLRRVE